METKELFTKDTLLYKKNGRYKNLIKAYDLYTNSFIVDDGMIINKTFSDRIAELNKNFMANLTCADLIRFVCYNPKMKCYRKSFIEFYNKIAKMYNALEHLSNNSTRLVVVEGDNNEY
jgi:hypothetical protein